MEIVHLTGLPREVVEVPILGYTKKCSWSVSCFSWPSFEKWCWTRWSPEVLSNPKASVILWEKGDIPTWEVASMKCQVGKQGVLCVLLRRVLHLVVMTGGHNRTSTVTEVLLGAVPYYMDMTYLGSAPPWCVCNMDITDRDMKSRKMSMGDRCWVSCV